MVECPKCLGAEEVITASGKDFDQKLCDVCGGAGYVPPNISEDFIESSKPFESEYSTSFN